MTRHGIRYESPPLGDLHRRTTSEEEAMRYLFGLLTVAVLLGSAPEARAQLSISIGNPYGGYGYGTGYYGVPYASSYSSYSSYVAPGTTFYSSGYSGYAYPGVARAYVAPVYPYGYAPAPGYVSTYRYGPVYGYGYRRGIPGLYRGFGRYGLPY